MTTSPESKWTKGPWSGPNKPYDSVPWLHIYCPDNKSLMHVSRSDEEKMANAILCIAAPDLYEALKLAETTLTRYIRTPPGEGMHEFSAEEMAQIVDAHPTFIAIRAALSKAQSIKEV